MAETGIGVASEAEELLKTAGFSIQKAIDSQKVRS
jgi:hypothetical protein